MLLTPQVSQLHPACSIQSAQPILAYTGDCVCPATVKLLVRCACSKSFSDQLETEFIWACAQLESEGASSQWSLDVQCIGQIMLAHPMQLLVVRVSYLGSHEQLSWNQ